jgi:hypothetical protein
MPRRVSITLMSANSPNYNGVWEIAACQRIVTKSIVHMTMAFSFVTSAFQFIHYSLP